jgi:hypothetical protein
MEELDLSKAEKLATFRASRRSFLRGSRLAAGAGAAFALATLVRVKSARAHHHEGDDEGDDNRGGHHCFLRGTRIETPEGLVAIEELRVGDAVLTASGEVKPVKWIGQQTIRRDAKAQWDKGAAPIKIARFAIDSKSPHTDLYVSPAHALYLDGILIPAHNLVNGITIVESAKPEATTLTYFHLELETHEAILAEGLAVESFGGHGRETFDNADEYVKLYGSLGELLAPFAPIVSYNGGKQKLASHVRSAIAPVYDARKPIDRIRDRICDRAEFASPG